MRTGNHMRPIVWHQYQWPWVNVKVTFVVWNLSNTHTAGNIARTNYYASTCELDSTGGMQFQLRYRSWRTSQGHLHCKSNDISETMQDRYVVTTDHWEIYGLSNSTNSDDLEWPSRSVTYCKPFQVGFFVELCSCRQDFIWHNASRGPSAITEPLV